MTNTIKNIDNLEELIYNYNNKQISSCNKQISRFNKQFSNYNKQYNNYHYAVANNSKGKDKIEKKCKEENPNITEKYNEIVEKNADIVDFYKKILNLAENIAVEAEKNKEAEASFGKKSIIKSEIIKFNLKNVINAIKKVDPGNLNICTYFTSEKPTDADKDISSSQSSESSDNTSVKNDDSEKSLNESSSDSSNNTEKLIASSQSLESLKNELNKN